MSDDVERLMIVLPCRHLADRPTRASATVDCTVCPRRFELVLTDGGRAWNAREVETEVSHG